jgi:hypothetical protein
LLLRLVTALKPQCPLGGGCISGSQTGNLFPIWEKTRHCTLSGKKTFYRAHRWRRLASHAFELEPLRSRLGRCSGAVNSHSFLASDAWREETPAALTVSGRCFSSLLALSAIWVLSLNKQRRGACRTRGHPGRGKSAWRVRRGRGRLPYWNGPAPLIGSGPSSSVHLARMTVAPPAPQGRVIQLALVAANRPTLIAPKVNRKRLKLRCLANAVARLRRWSAMPAGL